MRSGKCHLTSDGINTLATADPIRLSTLNATNAATDPTTARVSNPIVMAVNASTSSRCGPTRDAIRGARAPSAAKQTGGVAVIRPATPLLVCNPRSMPSSAAPTLVTAVRIDSPVSSRAAMSSHRCRRDPGDGCAGKGSGGRGPAGNGPAGRGTAGNARAGLVIVVGHGARGGGCPVARSSRGWAAGPLAGGITRASPRVDTPARLPAYCCRSIRTQTAPGAHCPSPRGSPIRVTHALKSRA
jgi:hypothetical protein